MMSSIIIEFLGCQSLRNWAHLYLEHLCDLARRNSILPMDLASQLDKVCQSLSVDH